MYWLEETAVVIVYYMLIRIQKCSYFSQYISNKHQQQTNSWLLTLHQLYFIMLSLSLSQCCQLIFISFLSLKLFFSSLKFIAFLLNVLFLKIVLVFSTLLIIYSNFVFTFKYASTLTTNEKNKFEILNWLKQFYSPFLIWEWTTNNFLIIKLTQIFWRNSMII